MNIRSLVKTIMFAIGAGLFCTPTVQASPFPNPIFVGPFPEDYLPPIGTYEGQFHSWGNGAFLLTNPAHSGFSASFPPPPSIQGECTVHPLNSSVSGNFLGLSIVGNGAMEVEVCFNHEDGADRFFDTELLKLDISGGSLPANVFIREDPDEASSGKTAIRDLGDGRFLIASFFDVFTELSVNGPGGPFIDSDGPTTMTLVPVPEPASALLLVVGLSGLGAAAGWRRLRVKK